MVKLGTLAGKIFGTANDRQIKAFRGRVEQINALENSLAALSDEDLRARTTVLREEFQTRKSLDDLLVPAFATVREAAKRVLGQRHYDVQLMGGMTLHEGRIAEMKTGEGKTLVATLAVYLNALAGKGVHVVTVNDYLASRDAAWMDKIYSFLGLTTGCIIHGLSHQERAAAYAADITYGTNNEFGFDYLRDNTAFHKEEMVQRGHSFAIVDEVDSILVDEARTPLIISGPLEDRSEFYNVVDQLIPNIEEDDFEIDEKLKSATFTDAGNERLEALLREKGMLRGETLYDVENVSIVHHLQQALRAYKNFVRDRDYIVHNREIVIIDEFTGRMMPGRRYSEGLHQALEAKEKVPIQPENQTLAQVTFQNYFRLYDKLAGMTGTAATEAEEFAEIYGLGVVEIPTNVPIARGDEDDEVYRTLNEKYNAIIELIKDCQGRGQPVLVGTTSIEKSEFLAELLKKEGLKQRDHTSTTSAKENSGNAPQFQVLNARYHDLEASIIAQAGIPGALTIATNMAGRGTDIQLGGNLEMRIETELADMEDGAAKEVAIAKIAEDIEAKKTTALAAGGLYVVGTERHESRRIDNQLRGRSGRQGDPGNSKFFLSLEDDLMRIFGSERMDSMLVKLGLEEGEAIVHPWINKALETAQQKVEGRHFDTRKQVLKFDDVMNDQRKAIFEQRLDLMDGEAVPETVIDMRYEVIEDLVSAHIPEKSYAEQWDTEGLGQKVQGIFGLELPVKDWAAEEGIAEDEIRGRLIKAVDEAAAGKVAKYGPDIIRQVEKAVLLQILDGLWREHLATLDHLRSVIGFRSYGQRDPLQEYKSEAFSLFETMLATLREATTAQLMHLELSFGDANEQPQELRDAADDTRHNAMAAAQQEAPQKEPKTNSAPVRSRKKSADERNPDDPASWGKVGRNEKCPCGSGKKYKQCHGADTA